MLSHSGEQEFQPQAMYESVNYHIENVLSALARGKSTTDSMAYDTAWIARLTPDYPGYGFERAVTWLRENQLEDGSWGGEIRHYHDRIISTLSAIIALHEVGDGHADQERIRAGERFLWHENGRLLHDAHDTIGFHVLAITLINQAIKHDLDVPRDLYRDIDKLEKKLNLLGRNPAAWRFTTLAISMEAVMDLVPQAAEVDLSEADGSVGMSPASTVATLMHSRNPNPKSLTYLQSVMDNQADAGAPFVQPMDIFEAIWTLNHFRTADAVSPNHPEVQRILLAIKDAWIPDRGVSFTKEFRVPDLDDTAVALTLLNWGGYPTSPDVFRHYEQEDYFACYPGELDMSLSVNMRTLVALQYCKDHPDYERWMRKIVSILRRSDLNGYFWFDKWHISPYYLTSTAIWSLYGTVDDLLPSRVKWLLKTQRPDGGWGYYGRSTAEETAYCLQALLFWYPRTIGYVEAEQLQAAADFLARHFDRTPYVPLWIGKGLYMPRHLVRSAILMALHMFNRYKRNEL